MKDSIQKNVSTAATIFIAVLALVVSIWEGIETRKHNRLSVKPHLDVVRQYSGFGKKGVLLENNGLGPAVIRKIEISISDSIINFSNPNEIQNLVNSLGLDSGTVTAMRDGYIVKNESCEDIMTINTDDYKSLEDTLFLKRFRAFIRGCEVSLDYESIYGDEFSRIR